MTRDMLLKPGDTIQFQINIGCTGVFSFESPVRLEYSHDGGHTWDYVRHACYPGGRALTDDDTTPHSPKDPTSHLCTGSSRELHEATQYHAGDYEGWTTVVIPVLSAIAEAPARFRWIQSVGNMSRTPVDWAIHNVYIGPSCVNRCEGNGICSYDLFYQPHCICNDGYQMDGSGLCHPKGQNPNGFSDNFNEFSTERWQAKGGEVSRGCGVVKSGNSMYFGGKGTRKLQTKPINTTNTRLVEFYLRLGSSENLEDCVASTTRDEAVVFQYSNDNGITWELIKELYFDIYQDQPVLVRLDIPLKAKTKNTIFRWWQPLPRNGLQRAQWALDGVIFGRPNLLENGFFDDFNSLGNIDGVASYDSHWYAVQGGRMGSDDRRGNSIVFDAMQEQPCYIETWDFYPLLASFIQFDIMVDCVEGSSFDVVLQYSVDAGDSWSPLVPQCLPGSNVGCEYGLGSYYHSSLNDQWTRHTIPLPEAVRLTEVRLRWAEGASGATCRWALDNVYMGDGCPWMCSGHGYCRPDGSNGASCRCDPGYEGSPQCHPSTTLKTYLKDDFNLPWDPNGKYTKVVGKGGMAVDDLVSVGIITEGDNIQFSGAGIRLLQTLPINTTDAIFIQFHLTYQIDAMRPFNKLLVQGSINNGVTWSTLYEVDGVTVPERKFINIILPPSMHHSNTVFRLWSSDVNTEENENTWAIDNLIIGGNANTCENYLLSDQFNIVNESNWAFNSGGQLLSYCSNNVANSGETSLLFNQTLGEVSLTTKDLCFTNTGYIIMFNIAVGCGEHGSRDHSVVFEYSTDHGSTWGAVEPLCTGYDGNAGCSITQHPSSVYYSGGMNKYRSIVILMDSVASSCSLDSVRFRWYQGHNVNYKDAMAATPWALSDVYIGPGVGDDCSREIFCTNKMSHSCDDGGFYAFACCIVNYTNFLHEDFEWQDPSTFPSKLWSTISGGSIATNMDNCHSNVFLANSFLMNQNSERLLATNYLDTRKATFIQFYIRLDGQDDQHIQEKSSPQFVLLQYSIDGGLSWITFKTFFFHSTLTGQSQFVALLLPETARFNGTSFRWWQPMVGAQQYEWSIDHIIVGHEVKELDDEFEEPNTLYWLEMASSALSRPDCCDGQCVTIGTDLSSKACGSWLVSNGVNVKPGSFIQFELHSDCGPYNSTCHELRLEYSKDLGHTWAPVIPDCNFDARCQSSYPGAVFNSDQFSVNNNGNHRVLIPLSETTWSQSTRFRWIQSLTSTHHQSWSIDNIYIGRSCPGGCTGHGRCHQHTCICDGGWKGERCETPHADLPTQIKDIFEAPHWNQPHSMYDVVLGGVIDDICGNLGFETALHFSGNCSRKLVTVAMDTREADFVQFTFLLSCARGSDLYETDRTHGVMIDYSRNGGITWHALSELYYDGANARFVNILLPMEARAVGTQFRFVQPEFGDGLEEQWAVDNLFIGGKQEEKMLSDAFTIGTYNIRPAGLYLDRDDKDMWQFYDNTFPSNFCGRNNVIKAGEFAGLPVSVGTKDFVAETGYILQYTIVVLCERTKKPHQPVHVQYSTDFGDSWHYVTPQCTPDDKDCFGKGISQPTVHFASPNWRRKTIWLDSKLLARPIRFRLYQYASDVVWALDRLYIGLACPEACSGHGDCVKDVGREPYCICDTGFTGPNCYLQQQHQTYLKDTFASASVTSRQWGILDNAESSGNCGHLIESDALTFDGVGPKQAETIDLDLRDARFVQYHAIIGSNRMETCLPVQHRHDGVILQYSTNGGISWQTLNELDYLSYNSSTYDYIELPLNARTNSTRVIWWQPYIIDPNTGLVTMGAERSGWAIDNVYIGGNEVNSHAFGFIFGAEPLPHDNIGVLPDEMFDFYPHGELGGTCGSNSNSMTWNPSNHSTYEHSITTRQLITAPEFMMQFMVNVGCGETINECSKDFEVRLEYKTNPLTSNWKLVKEECYPTTVSQPDCTLFNYHQPSTYEPMSDNVWRRVTILLDFLEAETTQFRWIQYSASAAHKPWALGDIYIGEKCPDLCSGHGACVLGPRCICDVGYTGIGCGEMTRPQYVKDFKDSFDSPVGMATNQTKWALVSGGAISYWRCGALLPHGSGKAANFYQCGTRVLQTTEMNLIRKSYVQYVLQMGSHRCDANHTTSRPHVGNVLLQFSVNNGITWKLLREHAPFHYMRGRRVFARLPAESRTAHTTLRWWQPTHEGEGRNQWAVDNVEIIMNQVDRHLHNLHLTSLTQKSQQDLLNSADTLLRHN